MVNDRGEARAIVSATNASVKRVDLDFTASLEGYERLIDTLITGTDQFQLPFKANAGDEAVVFNVELSRKDYNLFTDIALQVLAPDGEAIVNTAFDERESRAEMKLHGKDTVEYRLFFRGGLAVPHRGESFRLLIRERRLIEKHAELHTEPSHVDLAPSQQERVRISSIQALPVFPVGYSAYGSISGKLKSGEKLVVPIRF
jgi:hypothetical protein